MINPNFLLISFQTHFFMSQNQSSPSIPWSIHPSILPPEHLVIHKTKLSMVTAWLQTPSSPVLCLRGPSGSGKTTTLYSLATSMGINIIEWTESDLIHGSISLCPSLDFTSEDSDPCFQWSLILLDNLMYTAALRTSMEQLITSFLERYSPFNRTRLAIIDSDDDGISFLEKKEIWRILDSPAVTRIVFNPVARSFIKQCLNMVGNVRMNVNDVLDVSGSNLGIAINTLWWKTLLPSSPITHAGKHSHISFHHMLRSILKGGSSTQHLWSHHPDTVSFSFLLHLHENYLHTLPSNTCLDNIVEIFSLSVHILDSSFHLDPDLVYFLHIFPGMALHTINRNSPEAERDVFRSLKTPRYFQATREYRLHRSEPSQVKKCRIHF